MATQAAGEQGTTVQAAAVAAEVTGGGFNDDGSRTAALVPLHPGSDLFSQSGQSAGTLLSDGVREQVCLTD